MQEIEIEIGTIFKDRHMHYPLTYKIIDIHTTYNSENEVVKVICVCFFDLGQGMKGNKEIPIEKVKEFISMKKEGVCNE